MINLEVIHAKERWKILIDWGLTFGDAPDMPELSLFGDVGETSIADKLSKPFFIAETVNSLNHSCVKAMRILVMVYISE